MEKQHRLLTPLWSCPPDHPPLPRSCLPRSSWRSESLGRREHHGAPRMAPGRHGASSCSSTWADGKWCLPRAGRRTSPCHEYQCSWSHLGNEDNTNHKHDHINSLEYWGEEPAGGWGGGGNHDFEDKKRRKNKRKQSFYCNALPFS